MIPANKLNNKNGKLLVTSSRNPKKSTRLSPDYKKSATLLFMHI